MRILDSDRYDGALTISAAGGGSADVEVRLAAAPHARPTIVAGELRLVLDPGTTATLEGLLVTGGPVVLDEVADTERRRIVIRDTTS